MDNWFTSVPLAEKLLKQHKITVIGTIRKDKKELPADFVNLKFQDRKVNSSLSLFSENVTAASYKATEKKLATLISTLHDDEAIHPGSGKPEIIMNYNETKGGVDVLDRLCQDTNTGRKTKRWPMAFF
ncbi:transposase yabusame-1 [Nesidiocoris tenuis]|uniref:Transposase yabusame-1 n=1 Tax=Nesidiocoris tenuis TaxID=355587 RepID=A0ABN7AIT1_9HEMI|nr:transposase yabusame-1 [Nesidiocoris tenuis]